MNDKYIIASKGCVNVASEGKTVGYEMELRIPYYQGVPMSQVKYIRLKMDGAEVPREDIRVYSATGEEFTLDQILTVTYYYWEYGTPLKVRVLKEGGLTPGKHRLDVSASIDVIYAPDGFKADVWAEFEI